MSAKPRHYATQAAWKWLEEGPGRERDEVDRQAIREIIEELDEDLSWMDATSAAGDPHVNDALLCACHRKEQLVCPCGAKHYQSHISAKERMDLPIEEVDDRLIVRGLSIGGPDLGSRQDSGHE